MSENKISTINAFSFLIIHLFSKPLYFDSSPFQNFLSILKFAGHFWGGEWLGPTYRFSGKSQKLKYSRRDFQKRKKIYAGERINFWKFSRKKFVVQVRWFSWGTGIWVPETGFEKITNLFLRFSDIQIGFVFYIK